jgi:hypothetical protein
MNAAPGPDRLSRVMRTRIMRLRKRRAHGTRRASRTSHIGPMEPGVLVLWQSVRSVTSTPFSFNEISAASAVGPSSVHSFVPNVRVNSA